MEQKEYQKMYTRALEEGGLKIKRIRSVETLEVVDELTNRKLKSETRRRIDFVLKSRDQFYMSFIDFMSPYFLLKGELSKKLCTILCCMAEYDTGVVNISTYNREELCTKLQISKPQLSRCFAELKDKGILRELGKGSYFINPLIFWKGDLLKRVDAVQDFYVEFVIVPKNEKGAETKNVDQTLYESNN